MKPRSRARALMFSRRRLVLRSAAAVTATALLALAGCASNIGAGPASFFELRGATTVPAAGWIKAENSDSPGGVIYLSPRPVLEAGDVQRASAQKDAAGRVILVVQFTPAGTAKLTAASRELTGRQLAAVVDGRVTNMASVQEPMTINTMALTGFASLDEAVRVAQRLSSAR